MPVVDPIASQIICNGLPTEAVNFTGNIPNGVDYNWTNDRDDIGLPASGTGDITPFTAINTTTTPIVATVTVIPFSGCHGAPQSFTITINPTPTVEPIGSQTKCNGDQTDAVNFTGNMENGTTYNWANSNPAIGLTAVIGNTNIAPFAATNTGNTPITATIRVTPMANNCTGAPIEFTITVNPTPTVIKPDDQTICKDDRTEPVIFSGNMTNGVTYNWTNDNTNIGLAATSGNINIASFTATNAGSAPITATINVTPTANNCTGTTQSFTITVNPMPEVNTPANQTICNGLATEAINFTSNIPSGVTYNWTNSNTSIGLAASGNTDIASFTATNGGITPVTATITVTPVANGCTGDPKTFTITVNPVPTVDQPQDQTVCNGKSTTVVNFSGNMSSGVNYDWLNDNPSIGLNASGTGNITSFTATNNGTATEMAIITVTPKTNECTGSPVTFAFVIDPPSEAPTPVDYISCPTPMPTTMTWLSLVTGYTGTLNWYDVAAGGAPVAYPGNFDASVAQKKSYWVSETIDGCESRRAEIVVDISDEPPAPPVIHYDECAAVPGAPKTWQSLVTTAGNYTWYSADNDGSVLASEPGPFHTGTVMPETTYYVIVTDALGCKSKRAAVKARVKARPTAVLSDDPVICKGQTANLTVNFTGAQPFKFRYSDGSTTSPEITATVNPYTISSLSPSSTRSYSLVSLSDELCPAEVSEDLSGTSVITVNDRPAVGAITAVPAICSGDSFTPVEPDITENGEAVSPKIWQIGNLGGTFTQINNFPHTVNDSDNGKTLRFIAVNVCGRDTSETTITVDPLPVATILTAPEGKVCPDGAFEISGLVENGTLSWSNDGGGSFTNNTAENTSYSAVDADTGNTIILTLTVTSNNVCAPRTATATYSLTVVPFPDKPAVDPEGVAYYRTDIPFNNILVQRPGVVTPSSGATLLWWDNDIFDWVLTPPTPPTPLPDDYENKMYTYAVKQRLNAAPHCESLPEDVVVWIYLTPVPKVRDVIYCEGETTVQLNEPVIEKDLTGGYADSDIELKWYNSNNMSDNNYTDVNPTPSSATPGNTTYWVSQFNNVTNAESGRVPLTVTVYAKPVFNITNPGPECAPATVNITSNNVWQITNNTYSLDESAKYYDDAGGVTELPNPAAIAAVGKRDYYIRVALTMPFLTEAGNTHCYSEEIRPVEVDIRRLNALTIAGDNETCPNTSVNLTANPADSLNLRPLTYTWTGTNGLTDNKQSISTGNLPGAPFDQYTFTVTAGDGVCEKTAVHTITLKDAPVKGTMTLSEAGNAYTGTPLAVFTDNATGTFYSCGGDVLITTAYDYTDPDSFVWYRNDNDTKVADGKDLLITDMRSDGPRTYRLEYENNGCPTSVSVTVHSIPLSVSDNMTEADMALCEGDRFEATLTIICSETVDKIEWFKDGDKPVGSNQRTFVISSADPSHSGLYSYKVTNRGCTASGDIAGGIELNVSEEVRWALLETAVVCAGDEVIVGLEKVTPEGSVLKWRDDGTIQDDPAEGWTASVRPPFRQQGSGYRYTHTYTIDATYEYCTKEIVVPVYVDKPLEGYIAEIMPICEGESVVINAGSYDAQTYIWTSLAFEGEKRGARITESPAKTTIYYLEIFRGACTEKDNAIVVVNTNPRILYIDSVGARAREIVYDPYYGTLPFEFKVGNRPADGHPVKYDLLFAYHTYYIEDAAGCKAQWTEALIPPPLNPPIFFSPDGDGINDTWEVPLMRDFYPEAVVTIYDRFGKELARYRGGDTGWDGTYRSVAMPSTDYWYVIVIDEVDRRYTGHFTLLRQ
jgi:gliding motility-associated-like protein